MEWAKKPKRETKTVREAAKSAQEMHRVEERAYRRRKCLYKWKGQGTESHRQPLALKTRSAVNLKLEDALVE